ncbi:terminase large subunit, partial [Paracoccaceae bacterium]|nr:terminase large subunit [Paracoccaceae bacterium]
MITQLMTDENVFGKEFTGDSWNSWKALLSGFYGETCTDPEMFFALTQREPESLYNELWLVIGRRGGKSNMAALIAVYEAFLRDHRDQLARGEVATVMVVAADRRQARTIFRYIKGLIHANPMLSQMVANEKDTSIELTNRCVIEIGTANNRALRGYTISCAILDEIAFWSADGMSPDAEIVRGIRPALATLGGKLIALSSPYARRGVLWNTYKKHFSGNGKVLVAQAMSQTMNPTLSKEYIEDAYKEDNAAASAEFGAQFR